MTNGAKCPRCKSWEESGPLNWIVVATISGVVTAVLTALLTKAWALKMIEQKLTVVQSQPAVLGKYRMA